MRRVLVPLDGTDLAASILPAARRLAGSNGTLILVRDTGAAGAPGGEEARRYLQDLAGKLEAEGAAVEWHVTAAGDPAIAIDSGAEAFRADLVAAATHGRDSAGRIHAGSIAWRALLRSPVPVLLRHTQGGGPAEPKGAEGRHIMVPLDGSPLAESALSLARQLASEWGASLSIVHVLLEGDAEENARSYLNGVAAGWPTDFRAEIATGPVPDAIASLVGERGVTDIVMTSHGRTGVSRIIVGSVADELIHRLTCPIVVIPLLATLSDESRL